MVFSYFGVASSGLGALGVSWSALIIQLVTFILGYLVLRKWAFEPIIRMLSDRKKIIDDGLKLGEDMRKKQEELELRVEEELSKARIKADQIVQDALLEAKEFTLKLEDEANKKSELILADAKEKTKQEMDRAKQKLETELVELITEVSKAFVENQMDSQKDHILVSKLLNEQLKT
ncbi:MAG: ATP synthase F0 subunit B [Patescibacteria group bacterium]|jgi:F-type H+-transporting ATPase subunit b|nr:ATP synthase F0 subunit B [Patescibacteria group bacterium]